MVDAAINDNEKSLDDPSENGKDTVESKVHLTKIGVFELD